MNVKIKYSHKKKKPFSSILETESVFDIQKEILFLIYVLYA